MTDVRYDTFDVPVVGGPLRVGRWSTEPNGSKPVVLAVHGITANHRSLAALGEALAGDATVVAPDLRGRGRSAALSGPSSMRQHADDCVAVLDHLGATDPVVCIGHSMGGFVVIDLAHHHPERVRHVVLADGGPALPVPEGLDIDVVLTAVIGPAMERLSMTFESLDAYFDYWKAHPAASEVWNEQAESYFAYDLVGDAPEMRSCVNVDIIRQDATDTLVNERPPLPLPVPTTMLRAPRGIMNQEGGLYPLEVIEPICADAGIPLETLADVNHYTMVFEPKSVEAIADHIRKVL